MQAEGKEILYIGILSEYDLSPNGGLKSFTLKGAKRRFLENDKKTDNEDLGSESDYYTIPSNFLVIPFSEKILNINFRYFKDNDADEAQYDNTGKIDKFIQYISFAFVIICFINLYNKITEKKKSVVDNTGDSEKKIS